MILVVHKGCMAEDAGDVKHVHLKNLEIRDVRGKRERARRAWEQIKQAAFEDGLEPLGERNDTMTKVVFLVTTRLE